MLSQLDQLLEAVSDTARLELVLEQINPDIEAAEEVANNMQSVPSGLKVQFFDSKHELHFGGVKQLTRAANSRRSSECR